MTFSLSSKSHRRLEGVDYMLALCVKRAIKITETDFSVIQGLRTQTQQNELFRQGLSKVKFSNHQLGRAIDLQPWVGYSSDDIHDYLEVAYSMREAAIECGVSIRWGGFWDCKDITKITADEMLAGQIAQANNDDYLNDCPHFELSKGEK